MTNQTPEMHGVFPCPVSITKRDTNLSPEEEKVIKDLAASAKRLAQWGKIYDNEKISRKAKNMEKRIEKLEDNSHWECVDILNQSNPFRRFDTAAPSARPKV